MILYNLGFCSSAPIWKCKGSVIPQSFCVALPSALLGLFIEYHQKRETWGWSWGRDFFDIKAKAYALFVFVLGFLIIFRTQGAYARFTMGSYSLNAMRVALFDSAVCMMTFTEGTKAKAKDVEEFKHIVIRLLSLLHATSVSKVSRHEHQARLDKLEVIDLEGLDEASVEEMTQSDHSALLVYHHLNVTVTDAINSGLIHIPPPIAGRMYAKLSEGFAMFEHCKQIAQVPFPFPYAQTTLWLLLVHWIITPFVMCSWVKDRHDKGPVFLFTFLLVSLFWSMVFISKELENPFGEDENDLPIERMQLRFNKRLRKLLICSSSGHIPSVTSSANIDGVNSLSEYTSAEDIVNGLSQRERLTRQGSAGDGELSSDDDLSEHVSSRRVMISRSRGR